MKHIRLACALLSVSCAEPAVVGSRALDAAAANDIADASAGFDFGLPMPPDAASGPACPGSGSNALATCAALGIVVDPAYAARYSCFELGPVPGLPPRKYGGLTLAQGRCSTTLLIGGDANLDTGKLYAIGLTRDALGHINGFSGTAQIHTDAPFNDGGVVYGPGGVLFITRYPKNELQQTRAGSFAVDKVIGLAALGVAESTGSIGFVPGNFPGGGALKLVSWKGGEWYTLALRADALGTYDVTAAKHELDLPGGPEGFTYVAAGSPLFGVAGMLVSEWSANSLATYEVDAAGDPKLATRKAFITGLNGAEGAYRDPGTGDFFFSTWNSQTADRVIVVRGFAPIVE